MKPLYIFFLLFLFLLKVNFSQEYHDEIIFHSNGTIFSPLVMIQGEASILWTFDDSTTSSLTNPVKNYGSELLRKNRLKVTPWSAVIGINIGYDGEDGGSTSIPFVPDQKVSKVENLDLVASNLELWCSSYNMLDTLIFNNFINLETIECYSSTTLQKIYLANTPNLKRLCLEDNDLKTLDLSECTALQDIRAALNDYPDIIYPNNMSELWHICSRDNPQITNSSQFSNSERFPYISELLIWNSNQSGKFAINQTIADSIYIAAQTNNYTSVDFSGAFQNENGWAVINLGWNKINSINLEGCDQIKYLNLLNNELSPDSVDKVLQQINGFGTTNGFIDLRGNAIPTSTGFAVITNLEEKGWIVYTENYSDIRVFGNGNEIFNWDDVPNDSNLTDFDSVTVDNDSVVHNFIIKSVGTTDLRLWGRDFSGNSPYISISGLNASDFNIVLEPSGIIPPGDSTAFQISFNPSDFGLRTAVVSFPNNDWDNASFNFNIQGTGVSVTLIEDNQSFTSNKFELSHNYPNPFNPITKIRYQLPVGSNVIIKIYDILGSEVMELLNEQKEAGVYEVEFNSDNLSSGMYVYKISAVDPSSNSGQVFVQTKKMILLK